MADTILTIKQLEDLFQSVTSTVLGTTDGGAVRIEWPKDGAPAWQIDDDVCFITVNYNDDPITRQIETSYGPIDDSNASVSQTYTRVVRVNWTLYGPNSFDHADLIRSGLFKSSVTDTLSTNNVSLITDIPMPARVPELFNGQWWDRTSFYANFNELVVRNSSVPYIQSSNVQVLEG